MDIYRDARRRGIYPPLFPDPEENSCFSIYQIRWIKKKNASLISSSETFAKRGAICLSVRKIVEDILSYGSQSKRAKIAIHSFGKY